MCLGVAPRLFDCENDFYLPSTLSSDNQFRVNWLIDNDKYDLPNELRPVCHQKAHNYKSIYGRLDWNKPAGTITTGFHSPGRGRYVHPREPRVLTACEASLIQGFPLSYKFFSDKVNPGRNLLSKVIGDAVSPQMAKTIGLNIGLESLLSVESFSVSTMMTEDDLLTAS
jgi:DNA (cytosine-5)-methyltransferase 1